MRYPLFGIGQTGKSVIVTSQSYTNMYAELSQEPDKTPIAFYQRHGLDLFLAFGETPCRGALELNDFLYVIHRGTLWEVNNAGVKTNRGTLLSTDGRVSLATNGNLIQLVDGVNYYVYNSTDLSFTAGSDADYVASKSNTWIDGYFITDQLGSTDKTKWNRYSWSTDGLAYNALDFAAAEASPDPLVRVYNDNRELVLFGQFTTEFHANTGNPDQPFTRQSVIEWGLLARESVAKMNDSIIYLARNRMGRTQVVVLNGYTPQVVSNQSMSTVIDSYGDVANASGFSFMDGGHPFYILSFPSVGKSWMFDGSTKLWSQVSYGLTEAQYRGLFGSTFLNRALVFDYENGNVYQVNPNTYTDNGVIFAKELSGRHIFSDKLIRISRLTLDLETGVGLQDSTNRVLRVFMFSSIMSYLLSSPTTPATATVGSDPQVMLKVSKDGGKTFPIERWTSLGKIGRYLTRVFFNRLGIGRDFVFKVRITAPVKTVVTGAYIEA